jgi:hypothetical protein
MVELTYTPVDDIPKVRLYLVTVESGTDYGASRFTPSFEPASTAESSSLSSTESTSFCSWHTSSRRIRKGLRKHYNPIWGGQLLRVDCACARFCPLTCSLSDRTQHRNQYYGWRCVDCVRERREMGQARESALQPQLHLYETNDSQGSQGCHSHYCTVQLSSLVDAWTIGTLLYVSPPLKI